MDGWHNALYSLAPRLRSIFWEMIRPAMTRLETLYDEAMSQQGLARNMHKSTRSLSLHYAQGISTRKGRVLSGIKGMPEKACDLMINA